MKPPHYRLIKSSACRKHTVLSTLYSVLALHMLTSHLPPASFLWTSQDAGLRRTQHGCHAMQFNLDVLISLMDWSRLSPTYMKPKNQGPRAKGKHDHGTLWMCNSVQPNQVRVRSNQLLYICNLYMQIPNND